MKERTVEEIVSTLKTLSKFEQTFDLFFNDAANILEFEHKRFHAMKKENDDLRAQLESLQPAPPKRIPPKDAKVKVWNGYGVKTNRHSTGSLNNEGMLVCYDGGTTSFTSGGVVYPWPHWEEAE